MDTYLMTSPCFGLEGNECNLPVACQAMKIGMGFLTIGIDFVDIALRGSFCYSKIDVSFNLFWKAMNKGMVGFSHTTVLKLQAQMTMTVGVFGEHNDT